MAKNTFSIAGIKDIIQLIEGDALIALQTINNFSFCFIDCEKELYEHVWDIVSSKVVPGGIIVADNAINHYSILKPMIDKALKDSDFDSMVVPIGHGELVCRRKVTI